MNKILLSIMTMGIAAALMGVGTFAVWEHSETSSANTIGTLSFSNTMSADVYDVNNDPPSGTPTTKNIQATTIFNVANVGPGDVQTIIFEDSPGKKVLMTGNQAFARGIIEAGIKFSANYPGTPMSEVGDFLFAYCKENKNFLFDYAINEKVAFESCVGASWAGVRSAVLFKHVGLNVAADPLHTVPYSGVNGGFLIISGGDPAIKSSTNAQDNRLYSLHTKIPILEPSSVQE